MDNNGDNIRKERGDWSFDEGVSENFDSHISKSVPLYGDGHDLICDLSDFFLQSGSVCYDIGCSTGTLLRKLSAFTNKKNIKFVGIEEITEMSNKAISNTIDNPDVEIINDDVSKFNFEKSDLIVSYYTLQFIHPKIRQNIIDKIYESLNWGGAFIMFEKVRSNDARFQDIMTSLYYEYKLKQGYSPEEIFSKTRSLKGVLEPFSSNANVDSLKRAGFIDIITVMKYISFQGFLAIK